MWGWWALRVARGWGWDRVSPRWKPGEQDAGDPQGPPIHPSSTLAPTECDELFVRLMRMIADLSALRGYFAIRFIL